MDYGKLPNLAMNDNGFIFDPNSGYSYTSNETGLYIMRLLAQGLDRETICTQFLESYDVSEDNFNSDYEHYMLMLEALGLVDF